MKAIEEAAQRTIDRWKYTSVLGHNESKQKLDFIFTFIKTCRFEKKDATFQEEVITLQVYPFPTVFFRALAVMGQLIMYCYIK